MKYGVWRIVSSYLKMSERTVSSAYTIMCQVYPKCTHVWNTHMMPFLLSDCSLPRMWMFLVLEELRLRIVWGRRRPRKTYSQMWDSEIKDEKFIRMWRSSMPGCAGYAHGKSVNGSVFLVNFRSKRVRILEYPVIAVINLVVVLELLEPTCSRCQSDDTVEYTYKACRIVKHVDGTKHKENRYFNLCLRCVSQMDTDLEEDVIVDAQSQQLWAIEREQGDEDD